MQPRILLKRRFDFDTVQVQFTPESRWQIDPDVRAQADRLWEQELAANKEKGIPSWDGVYYRLDDPRELLELDDTEPVRLNMSTVSYRYISTYRELSEYYDAHPDQNTNHISTCSIIRTVDKYWVFGARTAAYVRTESVDLIGGGLQPKELEVRTGHDIYLSLLKEFREEAGILPEHVAECSCIGILHSAVSNVLLVALTELKLSKDEVEKAFTGKLEDEMQGLYLLEEDKLAEYMSTMSSYRALIPELLG